MYVKPSAKSVEATADVGLCCHVYVDPVAVVRTPLCGVPWCEIFRDCSVTVGPVTVTGN